MIPPAFARTVAEVHGRAGEAWLEQLPALLEWCSGRWGVTVAEPFPDLSYNYVTPGRLRDGAPVVLKTGYPTQELLREIEALRAYAGTGAVRLLSAEPGRGALLLERLRPGRSLSRTPGEQPRAARLAAGVMRQLWSAALPPEGWSTRAWLSQMESKAPGLLARDPGRAFPAEWLSRALRLAAVSEGEPVLLHGDLHHGNVLSHGDGWRAIDAWGLVGEPAWEPAAFLLNAVPGDFDRSSRAALLRELVRVFADELCLDPGRIRDLAIVKAVLSAFWTLEDHGRGWESAILTAETLDAL